MEQYYCSRSGELIPEARVEFLRESGLPPSEWTTVKYAKTARKKGIFSGEVGTSELLIVSKVYDDSVRSVFRNAAEEADPESEIPEGDLKHED